MVGREVPGGPDSDWRPAARGDPLLEDLDTTRNDAGRRQRRSATLCLDVPLGAVRPIAWSQPADQQLSRLSRRSQLDVDRRQPIARTAV